MRGIKLKNSIIRLILINTFTFFSYFLFAYFSFSLSSYDQVNVPIWPPAGISLSLVLILGRKSLPGIFLGSWISNSLFFYLIETLLFSTFQHSLPFLLGINNVILSYLGRHFIFKFSLVNSEFLLPSEILKFLLYGGVLPSLFASILAGLSLFHSDKISLDSLTNTIFSWWISDFLGIALFSPLINVIWNRLVKRESNMRFLLISIGILSSILIAIVFYVLAKKWEDKYIQTKLNSSGEIIAKTIEGNLKENIRVVKFLGIFLSNSENLTKEKFDNYSKSAISQSDSVIALSWNPHISHSVRQREEKELSINYPNSKGIMNRSSSGEVIPAERDNEYIFVKFIYPIEGNQNAIGFNVYSNQIRRIALLNAENFHRTEITGRIRLIQEKDDNFGILVFHPVLTNLGEKGFSTAIIRMPSLIQPVMNGENQDFYCLRVWDHTGNGEDNLLFQSTCDKSNYSSSNQFVSTGKIITPSGEWLIEFRATKKFVIHNFNHTSNIILIITSLFTIILEILIFVITGREKLIQQIVDKKTEELQKANRIKSEFLANITHELRTPINGALGMISLLQQTPLNSEQIEYLENTNTSLQSLSLLMNDIIDVSDLEANRFQITEYTFNFYDLLINLQKNYHQKISRKGLEFDFLMTGISETCILNSDKSKIKQMFTHLIENAIKFTESGSIKFHISLTTNDSESLIHSIIEDTGIGIEESQKEKLFQKFIQLDISRTKKYFGSGLGLYITREILNLLNGKITLESEIHRGTKINLTFPVKIVENPNISPKEEMNSLNILVVEDNLMNQKFIIRLLEKRGHKIILASNGKEAIEKLDQNQKEKDKIQLILMDIQMPEMDGLTASIHIRKRIDSYSKLPIIAVTANSTSEQINEYLNAGMDDCVPKPINKQELFNKISKHTVRK